MSQQVLMRGKVTEVCPDRSSSMPWLHTPEVRDLTYMPDPVTCPQRAT